MSSHSYSYSMDDDDPFSSAPSPAVTSGSSVHLRDRPPSLSSSTAAAAARQSSRQSGEWSTRLSTGGGGSSKRDSALPPTRQGVLKPEDTLKVDAFRLVKPESSPLSITALETLSVLEKQKQAQKETRTYKNSEESDIDWELNLSSWKDRRKSKSSYQPKALEVAEDETADSSSGKKSKTFKELMEQKEKRSNGHSKYTFENEESPSVETLPTASSKHETQPTTTDTKYGNRPKHSDPPSGKVSATKESATESHSTARYNFTEASDREPSASSTRTSGYASVVGHGTRASHVRDSNAESYSTSRDNLTEAPAKSSDVDSHPASRYTSEHVSEVGHGTSASHLSNRSAPERETDDGQKPYELTVDLQVQSTKRETDPVNLQKKKTTTTTSEPTGVRPLNAEPDISKTSWQAAPDRQKSETYSAVKTTSAFEVQLREKPKGSQPSVRPSSYAYTPSTRPSDTFLKSDTGRPAARVEARLPAGSSSNRDSFNSRRLEQTANRDGRVKSAFELNIERSFSTDKGNRSGFRPPHVTVTGTGSSSSRFKQNLSLFQTKEAEGGGVGPVRALPPPVETQRSVGKICRLPGQDVKPSYSVVEMRRGSATERKYQPDMSSSYKTDAARLRGVSRSVQGLDMHRSDFGNTDARNPSPQSDSLSRYRDEKYGSRSVGKSDVSDANSVETSSSRAHSSDEEREKNGTREATGVDVKSSYSWKETRDSDPQGRVTSKQIEAELPRGSISATRYSSLYDRPSGLQDKSTLGSGGNHSTSSKIDDWDKKPGSNISRDDNQRMTETSNEDLRIRTIRTDDDTRRDSEPSRLNEPKDLYAYKHRSSLMEESVIGSRDIGKPTKKYDESTRGHDDKHSETRSSRYESLKTDPAVRYDIKESHTRDEHKKSDAAPYRVPYQEPGLQSYQPQRATQQASISDIFSKRSSAAVIRGKSVVGETEQHFVPSVVPKVVETTQTGITARSPAEREMTRRLEAAVDNTIKEFHDADKTTRIRTQEVPLGRTDNDVTSVTRTLEDGSSRRLHGLERTSYTTAEPISSKITAELEEPSSNRRVTLSEVKQEEKSVNKQPAFEVNFSVSEVDKPNRFEENKMDMGKVRSVAVEKEKQEQPAFELNFSVSELEKQRRSGENKVDTSNLGEEITLDKGHKTSFGDHKNAAVDKNSYQPQDSFHRPTGSVGRQGVDAEVKIDKTTPIGDRESSTGHRNEFQIEIDTKGLFPEKRIPAVSLSTDPNTVLHCGLQQELIVEFPESKDSTKKESVKDTTSDFYFGMPSGPPEEIRQPGKTTGRTAELVVEIPMPEVRQQSRADILPSQEHRSSPKEHTTSPEEHKLPSNDRKLPSYEHKLPSYEHKLPSHDHKLPSHEHKLPTEEHNLSQEPKTELKASPKEHRMPTLEHRLSSLSSQENKSRPEEHKTPSHDNKLPPFEHKSTTAAHQLSPLEPITLPEEHKFSAGDHKLPSYEHNLPKEEHKTLSSEHKLPTLEHRSSPVSSQEHISRSDEHIIPSKQTKLPSKERRLLPDEEKLPSLLSRDAKIGLVIDLDSHSAKVQPTATVISSDKAIIAELDTLLDGTRFDMNSNIPTDTKQTPPHHPRSTMIIQEELHHQSTSDPSHDKTTSKITVAPTSVDKNRIFEEPNGSLAASAVDVGEPVTEADPKTSSVPKKKPPAPPPKTKPKPKASNGSDIQSAEKDDWGFLSSSERLDVSANKDKCRLLTSAPMGAKRRPKSAMFPLLETSDPFGLGMTTDQNEPSKTEDDDSRGKVNGVDTDPAAVAPAASSSVELLPAALRLKSKGVRPVSYMEELNSSLFKKKSKETATPSDDDEVELKPPTSTHNKMEDATLTSGEHKRKAVEEDGNAEEQARQLESIGTEKARSGARVQIPGLMDELNISLKRKKRQENVQEEEKKEERKSDSLEVATGDLLNFSDDKDGKDDSEDDNVEGDAPPPPLPNAPPPLPNWSAFPGSSSTDPPLGLPPGPPPGPPHEQSLLDLSFSEDEPGQIHFRTTGLNVDQSHSHGDGNRGIAFQSSASDDMDFSFA